MSIHKSLKVKSALRRHRNVLSRSERIELLEVEGRWTEDTPVYGLPKVSNRKLRKKAKSAKPEGEAADAPEGAEGAAATPAESTDKK